MIAGDDTFLVLHNAAGPEFELATAPPRPTGRADWVPLLAHDLAVRLEDVDAYATHLVVQQRSGGLPRVRILDLGPEGSQESPTTGWWSSPASSRPPARAATRRSSSRRSGSA